MTESVTPVFPMVMWKAENKPNDLADLAKESSRRNVENVSWWLITTYRKIKDTDTLF